MYNYCGYDTPVHGALKVGMLYENVCIVSP